MDEDLAQRLAYGSFVSRKHRLFYLETPKALCTSMKWMLAIMEDVSVPLVWKHGESQLDLCIHYRDVHPLPPVTALPADEQRDVLEGAAYRRFAVVRSPYTRLLSAWANKICQLEPSFAQTGDAIIRHAGRTPSADEWPSFGEFVAWVTETNDPATCDPHWRPQALLLRPDVISYTDILRFERIADDLDAFFRAADATSGFDAHALLARLRFNESIALDLRGQYTEEIALRVAAYYRADFERFGYDVEGWREVGAAYSPAAAERTALKAIRARNRLIAWIGQMAVAQETAGRPPPDGQK